MRKTANMLAAVNERGSPVGEDHPRAELTDHEVSLVLELREDGFSLGWLARKFEVSKSCVQKICDGTRRSVAPTTYRRIRGGPRRR